MTKKMHGWSLAALPLAIGMATFSGSANAVAFNIGEVEAQLDSQLSVGVSMSTQNADSRFISVENGGYAVARTSDDGRQNYGSGDVFSKIFRGVHDLELRYGDSGAFFRGKYWYDFETKDGHQSFYDIDDSGRDPLQKGAGVALLDAFVYHNYFIGNNPGNVRLGRQVVSWGESTFIQNSINSINPIDVAALRRPGAELKEGLLPVEMLYLSQGLTENLSVEAFYQLKWAPTVLDNCGTFFGSDTLAKGCVDRLVVNGVDWEQGNPNLSTGWPYNPGLSRYIVRAKKDQEAKDEGQFGVAFRWFVPELNDSEFGFYAMNYHSRTPIYSNIAGGGAVPGASGVPGIDGVVGPAGYFFEYPEDIRLYGVSFQTSVAGASVGGEISYRPNMPMQINTGDMSRTALQLGADNTHRDYNGAALGSYIQGYERKEFWQAQVSVIQFFDRVLGASRLSLVGEAGVNYIGGLGDVKFGRDSLFGQSPYNGDEGSLPAGVVAGQCASAQTSTSKYRNSWCENDGFYTSWSSGYRIRATLDYSNVIAGINLSPNLSWSHDVEGYGPNFTEDAKAISVGLNADYGNKYNASISYTDFFDGKYNTAVDRDFASVSFSVSF
ncbi:hypothetical protein GCM10007421_09780 [Halopseudomonas oceani]|uniref:DUF1302 domain-containing protein n=1 Tax=Halopseudomonas oceani TaxID=1708783 RepID=A0A2P4EXJ2_9GAMM|nr:DUF1302 domain-containing protein [Halopseudomonas oceani]POB04711.1 DUF1302 domain-containing protein [Halopseudomonas oceani]GGE37996.1 hypothetical protein GCM10007421_09780 [Halopseudomonas oceani]